MPGRDPEKSHSSGWMKSSGMPEHASHTPTTSGLMNEAFKHAVLLASLAREQEQKGLKHLGWGGQLDKLVHEPQKSSYLNQQRNQGHKGIAEIQFKCQQGFSWTRDEMETKARPLPNSGGSTIHDLQLRWSFPWLATWYCLIGSKSSARSSEDLTSFSSTNQHVTTPQNDSKVWAR